MKKQYIAPDIYFEAFELSESIALGCDEDAVSGAEGLNYSDGYFLDSSTNMECTKIWTSENDGKWEGYCYWQGNIQLFSS